MSVNLEHGHPVGDVLLSEEELGAIDDEVAVKLMQRFKGESPLLIGVIKGGVPFALGVAKAIVRREPHYNPWLEYIQTETYGEGREAGETKIVVPLKPEIDLSSTPTAVLDDLRDTNKTLPAICSYLVEKHNACEVVTVVRVDKEGVERVGPDPDIVGRVIPNRWVAGDGPDAGDGNSYRYLSYLTAID